MLLQQGHGTAIGLVLLIRGIVIRQERVGHNLIHGVGLIDDLSIRRVNTQDRAQKVEPSVLEKQRHVQIKLARTLVVKQMHGSLPKGGLLV